MNCTRDDISVKRGYAQLAAPILTTTPIYATRQGIASSKAASGPLAAVVLLDFTESDDEDDSESEAEDTQSNETVAGHGDLNGQLTTDSETDSTAEWDESAVVWTGPVQLPSFQDAYQSYAVFTSSGLTGFPYWRRRIVLELKHAREALDNPAIRCYEPYRPLTEMSFRECVRFGYIGVGAWGQLLGVAFPDGDQGLWDLTDSAPSTSETQGLNWWHNNMHRMHQVAHALEEEEWAITVQERWQQFDAAPPHVQAQCIKELVEVQARRWETLRENCVKNWQPDYHRTKSQDILEMERRDTPQLVVQPIESCTCRRRCHPRVSVVETLVDSSDELHETVDMTCPSTRDWLRRHTSSGEAGTLRASLATKDEELMKLKKANYKIGVIDKQLEILCYRSKFKRNEVE
ncbi:hypothetical protein HDU78_000439 [Chytriomyces hyalinus]|nr:hypothetical protein HDU78_000439 [Chytriomyces hyalinus]